MARDCYDKRGYEVWNSEVGKRRRMDTHVLDQRDWENIRTSIEKENLDDPGTFSRLLKNYLDTMERLHHNYQSFCKSIFSPG